MNIVSGDDRTITIFILDEDGVAKDLTGLGIEFRLEDRLGAVVSKTIGAGVTLLPQSGDTIGKAEVQLDGADTAGAPAPQRWDTEVRVTAGIERVTAIQTTIMINPETT